MVSLYNLVTTITIDGIWVRVHGHGVRREVGFQHREAPSDRQSVVFVCPRENRQGHMKEGQLLGPLRLSSNRNMSGAVTLLVRFKRTTELRRTPKAKYNVNPRLDR
jgi:hypothetical protein